MTSEVPNGAQCEEFTSEMSPAVAEDHGGKCTNPRSVVNIILTAIGIGVVMLPTVFAKCGWIGGMLILCVAGLIANYMVGKLFVAIVSHPKGVKINTYEQLGHECFGKAGSIVTACIVHITMTGCCAVLLLLLGENTGKLWPVLSTKMWCTVWAVLCWPLSFLKSLHEVSFVATFGLVSLLVLFALIVVKGIENGITTDEPITYDWFVLDPLEFAVSFGNAMLSYHITNVEATLIRDMKFPKSFPKVASVSYLVIFVCYAGIGACGYYGYGSSLVDTPIMDRIAVPGMDLDVWGYICVVSLIGLAAPHYVVLLLPIAASLEYAFNVDMNGRNLRAFLKGAAVRTTLVAVTLLVAVTVPSVSKLIDLMGVFTMTTMAGILPALFYIKMRTMNEGSLKTVYNSSKLEIIGMFLIMALCLCMIAVGGTQAIITF